FVFAALREWGQLKAEPPKRASLTANPKRRGKSRRSCIDLSLVEHWARGNYITRDGNHIHPALWADRGRSFGIRPPMFGRVPGSNRGFGRFAAATSYPKMPN